MKHLLYVCGFSSVLSLAACAIAPVPVVLNPVGPDHAESAANRGTGRLKVYSGYDANSFGSDDAKPFQNAAYEIRAENGTLLETIPNSYGLRAGDQPTSVELAAGSYRITAWSAKSGLVTVPVTIASGRMTSVHLEATAARG